nr:hypothetical protein [uncultured Methanolobus sp.]
MAEIGSSLIPAINKKTVITCFIAVGWCFIALIAATSIGIVSYHEVKYLFRGISLSLPVWVLFMANPNSQNLSGKDEKIAIKAMVITFAVFVIVALASMLHGNI